jgi:hypothetical protein
MPEIRLQKTIGRKSWPSAIWKLVDYPNLIVYRNSDRRWYASMLGLDEEASLVALRALSRVEKHTFVTRREAVQALRVALMLEEE